MQSECKWHQQAATAATTATTPARKFNCNLNRTQCQYSFRSALSLTARRFQLDICIFAVLRILADRQLAPNRMGEGAVNSFG